MTSIHSVNLRGIDLNLLTVFDAIMAEGNQSRAARRLGMSQPAMSNALSRLRATLDDPLFVRSGQGMAPTPGARALAAPVRQALDLLQTGLQRTRRGNSFDYESSALSVVIALEDYADSVILPRLMDWLNQTAPGVHVRLLRQPSQSVLTRKLVDGGVHLAINFRGTSDPALASAPLLVDEFVSMVRLDHPTVGDALSLGQYLALPHVVYGQLGHGGIRNSIVDRELKRLGLQRHIALQVPGFQSMPFVVQNTQFVCTLPRRMAQAFSGQFLLKALRTPLELPPLTLRMSWSKALERDSGQHWFRESLRELCRRL